MSFKFVKSFQLYIPKDPQPPESWTEPLNCTEERSQFWNLNGARVVGSFDSLHVNVYSNNITPSSPYPVMVFIFGGAYHRCEKKLGNL